MPLFSIRMRASRAAKVPGARPEHVSGAERMAGAEAVPALARELARRGLAHPRGEPETLRISIDALDEADVLRIPALPARALPAPDAAREAAPALRGARQGLLRPPQG